MIKIAASILSADFSCLDRELKRVERAGVDLIHVDVMDGHFVPNITIGPVVVRGIRKITKLPLDVHLMVEQPEKYIDAFVDSGADMITVHIETVSGLRLKAYGLRLRKKGIKLGVSLNPATPLKRIEKVLPFVDFVLVMSVNPGFGGQAFIPSVLPKISKLRSIFKKDISVDGGVNDQVAPRIINAGADILAAGSYIFRSNHAKSAVKRLRNAK